MSDCIFCKIISGEAQAKIVYQDNNVIAFEDINPKEPVHVLIVPKKHLASVARVSEADQLILGKLMLAAKKIAEQLGVAGSGYRLQINNGPDAGQVVEHLHIHLLAGRKLEN